MSAIININQAYLLANQSTRPSSPPTQIPSSDRYTQSVDSVEFSPLGRSMAEAAEESSMRLARIRAIRTDIQAGTYETPERLSVTADRLMNLLR